MPVRAKFRCNGVTPSADGARVNLTAVTGGSAENDSFFKYTPSAVIDLNIVNPEAAEQFELGKTYFVDFTEAPN